MTDKKMDSPGALTRREFLAITGAAGLVLTVPTWLFSNKAVAQNGAKYGAVVDTRKCVNCKACQISCKVWNENEPDPFTRKTDFTAQTWTYVRETEIGEFPKVKFVTTKRQCMHCEKPACVENCPMEGKAIHKEPDGPVIVTHENCIKCQACVESCPYGVPRYDEKADRIEKCIFCYERLRAGLEPACIGTCPAGALRMGKLDDIASIARKAASDGYPVYGIGDTSWIYIFPKGVDPKSLI